MPLARAFGVDDELLAERLADRLRADPADQGVAMALADALERLGRDLDLLALLSARMEEGDAAVRQEVAPRRRNVLARLAARARAEGAPRRRSSTRCCSRASSPDRSLAARALAASRALGPRAAP